MSASRWVCLLGALLVLGGCSLTPQPDPAPTGGRTVATATVGNTTSSVVTSADLPLPPPGEVAVEIFAGRSQVTTGVLDVGQSSTEVQIAEILSEFDAARTDLGSVVTLEEQVLFDFDSAILKPEAAPALDRIAEALALADPRGVTIRGHTDSRGADAYNLELSQRRASAVLDYFVATRGLSAARFQAVGLGESAPVAANEGPGGVDDPAGRQLNRRVEIILADA